jgi:molybdopterin biosynthesis enzyme MoaB
VLTISDTRTSETDTGGDVVEETMRGAGHEVVAREIVRDEATSIRTTLVDLLARSDVDAVVTTGGTGISAGTPPTRSWSGWSRSGSTGSGSSSGCSPTRR